MPDIVGFEIIYLNVVFNIFSTIQAAQALDTLIEPNPYLQKDKNYLLPLEPKVFRKREDDHDG